MYQLKVKDFQRYKSLEMNIYGFCVIEGPSNLGKSSVRRALGVVTQNIWENNFVSVGAKNTVITLEADDISIQATKGSANEFLIKKGSEQFDYKKAGKNIPKEIMDSGFSPLMIGKESINLLMAKQYDPLFMVSYSDQQNTKILNAVFDVDTIEKANELVIRDILSQKRELKREIQVKEDKEKELSDLDIELERMKKLKSLYDKIDMIDSFRECSDELDENLEAMRKNEILLSKIDKIISLNKAFNKAIELQNKLKVYNELSNKLKRLETALKVILPILDKLKMIKQFKTDREELTNTISDLQDITNEIEQSKRAEEILKQFKSIRDYSVKADRLQYVEDRLSVISKADLLFKIQDKLVQLEKLPYIEEQIKVKNAGLEEVSIDIKALNEEYKSFGRCPCCNSVIH